MATDDSNNQPIEVINSTAVGSDQVLIASGERVLLQTANVPIQTAEGKLIMARVLLDSASHQAIVLLAVSISSIKLFSPSVAFAYSRSSLALASPFKSFKIFDQSLLHHSRSRPFVESLLIKYLASLSSPSK